MTALDTAINLHQQGRVEEAEAAYREILAAEPEHAGALHLLGVIRQQQGRHEEALELIGRAVALVPDTAVYRNNYGAVLFALGRQAEALAEFQRAVELHPQYADAWANLGMAQAAQGAAETAEASLRRALQIQPWHRDATTRLAVLLGEHARDAEARRLLAAGLAAGRCAAFHAGLGNLLLNAGLPDQAARQYRAAIELNPGDAIVHLSLGNARQELHDTAGARQGLFQAAELRPEKRLWRLRAELCGPVVFEDAGEIEEYCGRVERVVEEWRRQDRRPSPPAPLPVGEGSFAPSPPALRSTEFIPCAGEEEDDGINSVLRTRDGMNSVLRKKNLNDLLEAGAFPGFEFSYHGRDQRRLKEQFAALYEPYFRDQPPPQGSGLRDRKRIGILVTRRHEGIFLQSMRGIIERLDSTRFEVVILASRSILATLQTRIRRADLRFIPFGDTLPEAIRQVRAAACDLIYYWEVGSDAMNYFLPFARLAPVQCTGWGSAITSGVATVDNFLSSELVERPGSESQYTERLWKSRTLFRYQERLSATAAATPADFGLPEGRHLYVCLQNPMKLHPDFDVVLAGVLEGDPRGLVVLSADRSGEVARRLMERFARRIPQAVERIVFLPRRSFDDYCRLLQLADVVLDPRHFGAGITCYDMFSYDLPVVTWPGELIVGRITQACYRKMGVADLVVHSPEEYVHKAVQVATDRDYRKYVTERIAGASDVLYNDLQAVREHERFFEEALSYVK